jgi:hypothetical protein
LIIDLSPELIIKKNNISTTIFGNTKTNHII